MLVLGLDPGTATTGFGFVREHPDGTLEAVAFGVITTPPAMEMPQRLQKIYRDLTALIETYRPDAAAIEQLFFGRNITTGITVSQARGVQLLALANADLPIREYKPNAIKQAVAGYGGASKAQMQQMIQSLLNLDQIPRPDDAADALAIAIADINSQQYTRLMD